MDDYSLVPVEHQPEFENASLVPVEHDPFSDNGVTQQAQPASQAQRLATSHIPIPGDVNSAMPEAYQNPNVGLGAILMRAATNLATLPQRAIDASAADVQHLGESGYTPQSIGPAVETALMMMGASSAVPAAANELRAGIAIPRTPASRAAEKGYSGIGTTPNGGPTLVGSDHFYPARPGQRSVVNIKLTGSRRADEELANEEGGFTETPEGYMWHHVDDFDPQAGTSSLELVKVGAHRATLPHTGSVAQYEKHHGIPYKR